MQVSQNGPVVINKAAPGLPNGQAYGVQQGQGMPPPTSMAQNQPRNLHLQIQQMQHILNTGESPRMLAPQDKMSRPRPSLR